MSREMAWIGVLATILIAAVMGINVLREEDRQVETTLALRVEAVTAGIDRYAETCAICHGAAGEGLGATPPLNSAGVRAMDYTDLFNTIARGRYNTVMAAYSTDEGGIFTNAQIDTLVAVVQYANWDAVAARVAALGLTPPDVVVAEVPAEMRDAVSALPQGEALLAGLDIFVTECAACHGANAEGTTIAPALDTEVLRTQTPAETIERTIASGVPGTLMAGWSRALTNEDISNLVLLIQRWDELAGAGVAIPVIEAAPIDMSPQAIANGQWLYGLMCAQCHGTAGYGTRLAPALNSQQFLAQTPDAAISQIITLGVSGTVMPAWGGRLTDQDIASLVAYLRSWEPTAPEIVQPAPNTGVPANAPPWQNR